MGQFDLKIRNDVRPTMLTFDIQPVLSTTVANKQYVDNTIATALSGNTVSLSGDISGSGVNSITTTLSNTGVAAGSYSRVTVDLKGRITSGAHISLTGDATGTESAGSIAVTLANSGVNQGTYTKVTVDSKGRVTSGLSLSNSDITTALGYTPVNLAGATMTGNLRLNTNPSHPLDAATKQYIDSKIWLAIAVGY
jgi:phage-related tail fiber protein